MVSFKNPFSCRAKQEQQKLPPAGRWRCRLIPCLCAGFDVFVFLPLSFFLPSSLALFSHQCCLLANSHFVHLLLWNGKVGVRRAHTPSENPLARGGWPVSRSTGQRNPLYLHVCGLSLVPGALCRGVGEAAFFQDLSFVFFFLSHFLKPLSLVCLQGCVIVDGFPFILSVSPRVFSPCLDGYVNSFILWAYVLEKPGRKKKENDIGK